MKKASDKKDSGRPRMIVVPDDYAVVDEIGYRTHGEGLVQMIRSVKSRGSFTIGIFGEWGQGKTSMLRQIEKMLDDYEDDRLLTVWFNPWQFTGEEHLIIPFFHTVVAAMRSYRDRIEKTGKLADVLQKLDQFIQKLAAAPIAIAYGMDGEIKVPLFLKAKFSLSKIIDESRRQEKEIDERTEERLEKGYEEFVEEYGSLYYTLTKELRDSVEELGLKIVVLVDDLDRCLPDKAIELLEGLKVMMDLPNFVFVVGVAREVIERGVRVRYKELYLEKTSDVPWLERNYLDKIIQFPFSLPPANKERLNAHIRAQLEELSEVEPYVHTILDSLGNNPRNLKRFINAISLLTWVARAKEDKEKEPFRPELLIKISLIAFEFPALYGQIGRYPHHLIRIQEILQSFESDEAKIVDRHEEAEDVLIRIAGEKKTDIPEIDRWLEKHNVSKLSVILRNETRLVGGKRISDEGFRDRNEVERYVCMLAPTITTEAEEKPVDSSLHGTMEGRMIKIPGGTFTMGDDETNRRCEVTLDSFWMDKYPVTQPLYQEVMGTNPSSSEGSDKPVENVSWLDAVEFCNKLSDLHGLEHAYKINENSVEWIEESPGFRLSAEAEWEYACRAGTDGDRYGDIDEIAWYDKNSDGSTQGIGQKLPNTFGLYDMLGNVWEWCWDWYGDYPDDKATNPKGPPGGSRRVVRGGGWDFSARLCRSAYRGIVPPGIRDSNLGFRLSRSVP